MDLAEQRQLEPKIERLEKEIRTLKTELDSRQKLDEQFCQAQKMEAVASLSGGIAHDFNNILQCILGFTELALTNKSEENPDFKILKQIESIIKKGSDLTEQFLAFGRDINPQITPLNFNSIVTEVQNLLRRTIPKMIEIELELADDLKNINAHAGQCEQVLLNLCINAKDAMAEGGKLILKTKNIPLKDNHSQTLLNLPPRDYVCLTVSDNGRGMTKKTLDHIYEPFFTTKAKGEGTGLGLSMVYAIVKNHGGHIECHSKKDKGTTFRIYFPVIHILEGPAESMSQKNAAKSYRGNETILVVEDEADILAICQELLQKNDYTVLTASSGEEGIETYAQNAVDLVLLDVGMPGIGGQKCLQELLAIDPKAKVIIASGYPLNGQIREAMNLGSQAFLAKPYRLDVFLKTIRNVLDGALKK
jgi:signal transduction histidine kinase/CheY-like chemotaxis protein